MHRRGTDSRRGPSGMTLLELLVTMAVAAVLAGLAMPSMELLLAQWYRNNAIRGIVGHLQLARSSAIKSTRRVVVCNSQDGNQCADSDHRDWSSGWLVFQDSNGNNSLDSAETVIAVAGSRAGIETMASSNKVRRYVFLPNGLMASGMSSLVVTPKKGKSISIVVSRVGRIRLKED
jgi:type IV fimbrial biogenesis protein FimT